MSIHVKRKSGVGRRSKEASNADSSSALVDLRSFDLRWMLVFVVVAVLVLPGIVRSYQDNPYVIGSESYYHILLAQQLIDAKALNPFTPPSVASDSVFAERDRYFSPFHYLLAWLMVLLPSTSAKVLPAAFGALAVILFLAILSHFRFEKHEKYVILLVFVLNPAFMYMFSVLNAHAAAIVFTLAGFFFFLKKHRIFLVISTLCFSIVALFSIFNVVLTFALLLVYVLSSKEKQDWFISILFIVSLVAFFNRTELFYNYTTEVSRFDILGNLVSDLGSEIGFGAFSLILAVFGVAVGWKHKGNFLPYLVLTVALVILSLLVGGIANMYILFFVAIAAGVGFVRIVELEWKLRVIKHLTMLIIVCGFVFSSVSFMNRIISSEPDLPTTQSLSWMKDNTFRDGFVLSDYENGYWLLSVAQVKTFVDALSTQGYDQRFLYKVADSLFYSRNIKDVRGILERYNIRYVFITASMKEGGVWNRVDEGLLFLLSDKDTFKKVYTQGDVEIWRVEYEKPEDAQSAAQ
ncbi:hypothetical protein HY772_03490 [Candidatus Woesearchaeota archaeon]|nr:hypothetical protein [Candidatus Woesearchaeota archaeon]